MPEERIGVVDEYYARIGVVGIKLEARLAVRDVVHIKGHTTEFEQVVESMQIEHENVSEAEAGMAVAVRVKERCRDGDVVYRVT